MLKLILVIIVWIFAINSYSQTPTLLGLHGTSDPNTASKLGAKAVRYGFPDYKIKNVFSSGNGIALINKMSVFDSIGIEQVVYLRWPDDTIEVVGCDLERIPTGTDSIEVFQYLDTFLLAAGPYIDWIQINQEPLGITKYDDKIYSIPEIVQWWRTVAQFIREKQAACPTQLGHLKIMTGGISGIRNALSSPNSTVEALIDSIITFGEGYCDAIDLHLHTSSVIEGTNEIGYITDRTSFPLTCTEWSQSYAAIETGWLNDINTIWTDSLATYFGFTNKQVMDSAYAIPMDASDWNTFIATSPYAVNFIPDFYQILDSNCFIMACYAGVWQYGSPRFDWNHLIANKTVTEKLYPNNPFYTEYINLSSMLNSGSYNTKCPINATENAIWQLFKIFPNPTTGIFTIEADNIQSIVITNINGQVIYSSDNYELSDMFQIDLTEQPKGIYLIRIVADKGILVGKVVLE